MSIATAGFYNTVAWRETRRAYRKSVGGLCERCYQKGIYKAGVIVHHKIPIDVNNMTDPNITLSWDNLMLLCRDCHADVHKDRERRYTVDSLGRVTAV